MNPDLAEGRVQRSARLVGVAWDTIKRDRAMLVLAAVAAIFNLAGTVLILKFAGWHHGRVSSQGRLLLVAAIAAYPLTFVSVFLNVALAAAASARLDGRRIDLFEALGIAMERIGQIALWSALAAGVGVLLQELANRLPGGGRLASWALGAAWALVTMFAIPILALEGCGAVSCVRRSAGLMRERWGEGLTGNVAIGAVFGVVAGVCGGVTGLGLSLSAEGSNGAFVFVAIGLAGIVLSMTLAGATRQVFAVALYRYALTGEATGGFELADLERPTRPKRRLFKRGD
jgi:Family of unknown function (DUF6159)